MVKIQTGSSKEKKWMVVDERNIYIIHTHHNFGLYLGTGKISVICSYFMEGKNPRGRGESAFPYFQSIGSLGSPLECKECAFPPLQMSFSVGYEL